MEDLRRNVTTTTQKIKNWLHNFLDKHSPKDGAYELNVELMVAQFMRDEVVFELPPGNKGE